MFLLISTIFTFMSFLFGSSSILGFAQVNFSSGLNENSTRADGVIIGQSAESNPNSTIIDGVETNYTFD